MKLALWSPRVAPGDGLVALLPFLARRVDIVRVREGDPVPSAVDLDLYDVADAPAHTFTFRAARARPGVVLLREWSLPALLAGEMAGSETRAAALREMLRTHGEDGVFVARQVGRGLGGSFLPMLFPLNDRLLEGSLGVVALTEETRARVARRLGDERVLLLPLHLVAACAAVLPRTEARRGLGLPDTALVVATALPTVRLPSLVRSVAGLRGEFPELRLLVGAGSPPAGALTAPDLLTMAAAADVIVALGPSDIPAGLPEGLAARRPLVLSSDSPAAADLPEGTVALVEPGRLEEAELRAMLGHLLRSGDLRARLGRLAAEEARRRADPAAVADALVAFVLRLEKDKAAILEALRTARAREDTVLGYLADEIHGGARSLGLHGLDLGVEPLLESLLRAVL